MIYTAIQKAISLINEETQHETPDCIVHRLEVGHIQSEVETISLTGKIKIWAEYKDEDDMDNNAFDPEGNIFSSEEFLINRVRVKADTTI